MSFALDVSHIRLSALLALVDSLVASLRAFRAHSNRIADPEPLREATWLAEVWMSGNRVPPHLVLALAALTWGQPDCGGPVAPEGSGGAGGVAGGTGLGAGG